MFYTRCVYDIHISQRVLVIGFPRQGAVVQEMSFNKFNCADVTRSGFADKQTILVAMRVDRYCMETAVGAADWDIFVHHAVKLGLVAHHALTYVQ
jgi:hypothetical protein